MKKIFILLLLFLTMTGFIIRGQSPPVRIGVVNNLDKQLTHLYVTGAANEDDIPTPYDFNLGAFIRNEVSRVFDSLNFQLHTHYEVIPLEIPKKYNPKLGFLNLVGKPAKKIRLWFEEIANAQQVAYVIILESNLPRPNSKDAFLAGYDYGIASYDHINDLLTYFALVKYLVFKTEPPKQIEWDYPTKYLHDVLLYDFKLDEDLSAEEIRKLPDIHIAFAIESVLNMTLIQVEKILRSIVHDMHVSGLER